MITLGLTESAMLTDLRSFLLLITNGAIEVVLGQVNRVAEPEGPDYIVFWPTARLALATPTVTYSTTDPAPLVQASTLSTQLEVQVDVHGPNSADTAQVVATLWRNEFACAQLAVVQPLYAQDPRQMPFINGEKQYEDRWVVVLAMQANPTVSTAQQFADTLTVGLIEVDATYPSEP